MPATPEELLTRLSAQLRRSNGYQARAEIEAILAPLRADPRRLEPFGFKVYSQNDEDGILEEICRRLGLGPGRFVEIGVENGLECNSLYLIHKGWRGLWVEGNKAQKAAIDARFGAILGRRLDVAYGWMTAENVNGALRGLGVGDDLDVLSIDIDGNDIHLLEVLAIRPKVIVIEYNAKFPAGLDKRPVYDPGHTWRGTDYAGASLKAIERAGAARGYRLVGANITGANAFLVRTDLAGELFATDATAEALYQPPRYWLWMDHFANIGHPADFGPYEDLAEA